MTSNSDVAGTEIVDCELEKNLNTLSWMYKWGRTSGMEGLLQEIYGQIPEGYEDEFFMVKAVHANYLRKIAVKAGEEGMYFESERMVKEAFTMMERAHEDSGLEMENWLNSSKYVDNNRLGNWILLDVWGLLQRDYVLAGISSGDDPVYDLYSALDCFEQGEKLVSGLEGDWCLLKGISEKHTKEINKALEE